MFVSGARRRDARRKHEGTQARREFRRRRPASTQPVRQQPRVRRAQYLAEPDRGRADDVVPHDYHVRDGADVEAFRDDDSGIASRLTGLVDGGELSHMVDLWVLLRATTTAVAADHHGDRRHLERSGRLQSRANELSQQRHLDEPADEEHHDAKPFDGRHLEQVADDDEHAATE